MNSNNYIFTVSKNWLQFEAEKQIGRQLNEDEIRTAKKCIEWELSTGIETIFQSAIEEATEAT